MGISIGELEKKRVSSTALGAGGRVIERRIEDGVIGNDIIKYRLYDRIISYPVVSLAVLRAFQRRDSSLRLEWIPMKVISMQMAHSFLKAKGAENFQLYLLTFKHLRS